MHSSAGYERSALSRTRVETTPRKPSKPRSKDFDSERKVKKEVKDVFSF